MLRAGCYARVDLTTLIVFPPLVKLYLSELRPIEIEASQVLAQPVRVVRCGLATHARC